MATKNLEPTANTPKTHRVPHTKKKHASERGRALCEVRRALWCFSAGVVWLMENGCGEAPLQRNSQLDFCFISAASLPSKCTRQQWRARNS